MINLLGRIAFAPFLLLLRAIFATLAPHCVWCSAGEQSPTRSLTINLEIASTWNTTMSRKDTQIQSLAILVSADIDKPPGG